MAAKVLTFTFLILGFDALTKILVAVLLGALMLSRAARTELIGMDMVHT
jgi:hypothetical protein